MAKNAVQALISFYDLPNSSAKLVGRNLSAVFDKTPMLVDNDDNYINYRYGANNKLNGFNSESINNNHCDKSFKSDPDELRGHLWYHGAIGRTQAETLVDSREAASSGKFLVRDCISRPGDYVLSCNWKGDPLHFMISRSVLNPKTVYERVMYQFEDEAYRSVPDLIRAYVGQQKTITDESRCMISTPINRSAGYSPKKQSPIDPSTIIGLSTTDDDRIVDDERQQGNYARVKRRLPAQNGIDNPKIVELPATMQNRPLPPVPAVLSNGHSSSAKSSPLRNKVVLREARRQQLNKWRSESCLQQPNGDAPDGRPTFSICKSSAQISGSLRSLVNVDDRSDADAKPAKTAETAGTAGNAGTAKSLGQTITTTTTTTPISTPPPKPTKAPSLTKTASVIVKDECDGGFRELNTDDHDYDQDYHEYCDIDYEELSCGRNSLQKPSSSSFAAAAAATATPPTPTPTPTPNPPPLPPRPAGRPVLPECFYDQIGAACRPVFSNETESIDSRPVTSLRKVAPPVGSLPADVKPLDARVWSEIVQFLLDVDAATLAAAISVEDGKFLNLFDDTATSSLHSPSLLQLLVPQGAEFRTEISERVVCWRLLIASSILKEDSLEFRTRLLAKWIDVAGFARERCGNHFAFSNVMSALLSLQIAQLTRCWQRLRVEYTHQAELFDTVWRPALDDMQKFHCSRRSAKANRYNFDQPVQMCVPDLMPIVQVLQAVDCKQSVLYDWEEDPEYTFGLDALWLRLSYGRQWLNHLHTWRENLIRMSTELRNNCENERYAGFMSDFCRTEFHLLYLFGAKGSTVQAADRYRTFERILTVMAQKVVTT